MGTYVQRTTGKGKTHDATLCMAIADPGRHYVIHGPSKVGKTQLWQAVLGPEAVPVPCPGLTDIQQLYAHALYRLKKPYLVAEADTETVTSTEEAQGSVTAGYEKIISVGLSLSSSQDSSIQRERQFAYESQPKAALVVADAFAAQGAYLVLENYHRLSLDILSALAKDLREFSDKGVSVLLVGIPQDPYNLFDLNRELASRVEYLPLTWWCKEDLAQIAQYGARALNVEFSEDTINLVATEAAGSPLLMQQFCLIACLASDVTSWCTEQEHKEVNLSRADLAHAIRRWVANALAPYKACTAIINQCAAKVGLSGNVGASILKAFKTGEPRMAFSFRQVGLGEQSPDTVSALLCELDQHPRTRELLSMQSGRREIAVRDPGFFLHGRWIA